MVHCGSLPAFPSPRTRKVSDLRMSCNGRTAETVQRSPTSGMRTQHAICMLRLLPRVQPGAQYMYVRRMGWRKGLLGCRRHRFAQRGCEMDGPSPQVWAGTGYSRLLRCLTVIGRLLSSDHVSGRKGGAGDEWASSQQSSTPAERALMQCCPLSALDRSRRHLLSPMTLQAIFLTWGLVGSSRYPFPGVACGEWEEDPWVKYTVFV